MCLHIVRYGLEVQSFVSPESKMVTWKSGAEQIDLFHWLLIWSLKMKRNKDKGEAEDDESKLYMSTLSRKCAEKKIHYDKFREALLI